MSLHALRRVVVPVLATALLGAGGAAVVVATPSTAFAASNPSMESQFVAKLNAARSANGLTAYSVAYDLVSVARAHSDAMARQQQLYHNPSLTSDVHSWQAVGENVGEGPTVSDIHQAFMQSPEHRANILDHDFTQVGIGVTVGRDGTVWVTEDFREPMSSSGSHSSGSHHVGTHHSSGTHHVSSTHHAAWHPVTTPAAPSSQTSTSQSAGTRAAATATPRPARSPRSLLMHRLRQLRQRNGGRSGGDPVAQSFAYVTALSRLAG